MALVLLVVLAAAHLEDAHLLVLAVRDDRRLHRGTGHQGDADLQVAAVAERENLIDRDFLADVRSNLFYLDLVAGSNAILLASGFYDRVHSDLLKGETPDGVSCFLCRTDFRRAQDYTIVC